MSKLDREADLVHELITHAAGYSLVMKGYLYIKADDYDWEVGWREEENGIEMDFHKHFPEALEAAKFFVEKRHELKLGDEYGKTT